MSSAPSAATAPSYPLTLRLVTSIAPILRITQNASAATFSIFAIVHLAAPLSALLPSRPKYLTSAENRANGFALLGREVYQGEWSELALVWGSLTAHVVSGIALRWLRVVERVERRKIRKEEAKRKAREMATIRPGEVEVELPTITKATEVEKNLVADEVEELEAELVATTTNDEELVVPASVSPAPLIPLPNFHQTMGYALIPFVAHHAWLHRLLPSSPLPPIFALSPSFFNYSFTAFSLRHDSPLLRYGSAVCYAAVVGLGTYHGLVGWRILLDPTAPRSLAPSRRRPGGKDRRVPHGKEWQAAWVTLVAGSQAASDGGVDSIPRTTWDGIKKARTPPSPNGQDGWSVLSVDHSENGVALGPSPMRWTSSSGVSSLGAVVYDDWPSLEDAEAAPVTLQADAVPAKERPKASEKRWSLYTLENVERLREEEDGAVLVWLDLPAMPEEVLFPTPCRSAPQKTRFDRPQGFYLTPPSRRTPLTSPISFASAPVVDTNAAEDDFTFLPTSPVQRDRTLASAPVEAGCSLLHVLPRRKRRLASAFTPWAKSQAPLPQVPSDSAHLSFSRTTSPRFLALLGRSPPVPECELVARPRPISNAFDGDCVPVGPQGYWRVLVPRPDVKPGGQPFDLPPPPRPPSPRPPPLSLTQASSGTSRNVATPKPVLVHSSRQDKGKR
ncbi:hypothetical protein Rt10032_c16g5594 [Rhodotorula toruloides]|uniref:Uncharacterized protein n=1 Tax=Rhodotorula toruloides TaxID=5286 RepID=A0A511KML3_RHOTO|nr:hypothetical protein Rt10032_c16g5594 [Rhodotorula toruloides]